MKVGDIVYQRIDMREYSITEMKNESISLYSYTFNNGIKFEQTIVCLELEKFKRNYLTIKEIRKMKLKKINK